MLSRKPRQAWALPVFALEVGRGLGGAGGWWLKEKGVTPLEW